MRRHARGRSRDPRKIRLLALAGVVAACAIALPLAVASAGPVGSARAERAAAPVGAAARSSGSTADSGTSASRSDGRSGSSGAGGRSGSSGSGSDGRSGSSGAGRGSGSSGSAAARSSSRAGGEAPGVPSDAPGLTALAQGLSTSVRCGPELSSPDGVEGQTCVVTQGAQTWARTYYRNTTGRALDAALSLMGPGDRTLRTTCALGAEDEPGTCETPREPVRGKPAAYTAVAEFAERGGQGPLLLRSGSN